jgi:hypothetical protein
MVEALLARGGDASEALTMLNPLSQLPVMQSPSGSVSSTSVAGTSTIMSQALTLQGTPEPATSSTPVEVQKE